MEAAIEALSLRRPQKIVVAVPVAPSDTVDHLKTLADEVIVLDNPDNFRGAVGAHYQNFPQVEDEEVVEILTDVQDELAGTI